MTGSASKVPFGGREEAIRDGERVVQNSASPHAGAVEGWLRRCRAVLDQCGEVLSRAWLCSPLEGRPRPRARSDGARRDGARRDGATEWTEETLSDLVADIIQLIVESRDMRQRATVIASAAGEPG